MNALLAATLTLCLSLGLAACGALAETGQPMPGKLVKGSRVVGAKIFNRNAVHLGEIHDLLFNEHKGAIAYGVLDIGDWLGTGKDLIVVPWKHIQLSAGPASRFVLAVDTMKLKSAPHFPRNGWPALDEAWKRAAFAHYGLKGEPFRRVKLVRASRVIGAELWNQKAEKIGDIEELLLHPTVGTVAYAICAIGRWAAMDDKLAPVPWSRIRQSKEATPGYVLDVEKARLTDAVFFERKAWPAYNDPGWNIRTSTYYGVPYFWKHPTVY